MPMGSIIPAPLNRNGDLCGGVLAVVVGGCSWLASCWAVVGGCFSLAGVVDCANGLWCFFFFESIILL